jgi:lipopolysaccharide export system protein LptA
MRNLTWFFILLFNTYAWSLPEDKQQPIHFTAGEIEWDHIQSHGIFKNQVSFEQGSTKLDAASGYSLGDATHQFKKIVMKGDVKKQAHFITIPKNKEPEVNAFADTMIYLPIEKLIILKGHVHVTQGRYQFSAPYVKYNTELKKLLTKNNNQQQTTIIINPE